MIRTALYLGVMYWLLNPYWDHSITLMPLGTTVWAGLATVLWCFSIAVSLDESI